MCFKLEKQPIKEYSLSMSLLAEVFFLLRILAPQGAAILVKSFTMQYTKRLACIRDLIMCKHISWARHIHTIRLYQNGSTHRHAYTPFNEKVAHKSTEKATHPTATEHFPHPYPCCQLITRCITWPLDKMYM